MILNNESQGLTLDLKKGQTLKIFIGLLILFLLLRLPGITLPYHQDEWKNVSAARSAESAGAFFTHPPVMSLLFVAGHSVFGEDYFRFLPLLFSLASALLLFIIVKKRANEIVALWALFLFTVNFYNIFGSLQPDVDGAILPFLFLLAVYAYDRKWVFLLIMTLLAGLLIKLSFILVVGVLVADYIWNHWRELTTKKVVLGGAGLLVFGLVYISLLYVIQALYSAFSIKGMLGHAGQYSDGTGRNYIQIIVQGVKALYYLSPLLLIPILFLTKEIFRKTRIFFIYLIFGFIFYFILFDFSRGALDKYLMFMIVPLCIISGSIIAKILETSDRLPKMSKKIFILVGVALSLTLFDLNFIPQQVLALYPKTEWFSSVLRGHWNILTPFTGGSGPTGFYISFLFIATSFLTSIILGITCLFKKNWRPNLIIVILIIGLAYNLVFAEELLFGKINGNVAQVINRTTDYIQKTITIKKVLTYNDIGAQELSKIGKYAGRFYATPDFEAGHQKKFADFTGQYVVVDIPHLYENGFYGQFFSNCRVEYETRSSRITGRVYNCP